MNKSDLHNVDGKIKKIEKDFFCSFSYLRNFTYQEMQMVFQSHLLETIPIKRRDH